MPALRWLISIAIVAAAAWVIEVHSIALYAMNLDKRRIASRTSSILDAPIKAPLRGPQRARLNLEELAPLVRRFPWDPDLQLLRAENLHVIGRDAAAAEAHAAALRYHPAPVLYLSLAQTQFALGRTKEGLATLRRAVALDLDMAARARELTDATRLAAEVDARDSAPLIEPR